MEQYFENVVSGLTYEDINLLSILYDQDATIAFKSIRSKEVSQITGYTEAVFRRILYRLSGSKLIGVIPLNKQSGIYITSFGVEAISKSLKEVKV
jgi:hypothetical protein